MWVDMQEKKTVDVIIPVSYPDEKLQKILDRLEKQTHPVERIIVINTDEAGFPKNLRWPANMEVYHIAPEEFDHGATRDMAARKSTADLMLFMTQDAVPADTHLVEYLAKAFDDPSGFAIKEYDLSNSKAATLGMVCGGQVKVLFEKL